MLPEGNSKHCSYESNFLARLLKYSPPCPFQLKLITVQDLTLVNHWGSLTLTPEIKAHQERTRKLTCQWRSNPAQWIYHNRQVHNSRALLQQRYNISSCDWVVRAETGFSGRSEHRTVPPCHLRGERVWRQSLASCRVSNLMDKNAHSKLFRSCMDWKQILGKIANFKDILYLGRC